VLRSHFKTGGSSLKILIAEDDPVSRRLLEVMLAKWGYEVLVAPDGQEAWNILQEPDAPRLAILDWMMPGMDGVQICRAVRKQRAEPYTYLMLLTGKSGKENTVEGMDAGADDYITKPFNADELKVRLRAGRRIIDLQSELLSVREALREQATHDPLTGLPNRLLFSDRLTQSLATAKRREKLLAVMFLDLDRFKIINDTLGHNVGDQLLTHVANRLTTVLRDGDTIARMGGDEFTIILCDLDTTDEAAAIAGRVLDAFTGPVSLNGREMFISTSIGISIYPQDGSDVETLVRNADSAMYRAKELGRNTYQFYSASMDAESAARIALDSGLRKALEQKEFVTHYQARVDLNSGKVLGAEALVRWQHPEHGLIPPAKFIQLAEDTGLIVPLTEWVIHTACSQNKVWQEAGLLPMDITVNISTRSFQQGDLIKIVQEALSQNSLEPKYLKLELTESTLMHNPDVAVSTLEKLKAMGVKIMIDDFGTGQSSLSYLKRFPVDAVKIDQSFVKDITTTPDNAAIAGAIIAMAHSLKLKVIAEGVETLEQLEFLRSLNCDEMQGYFVSRPAPVDEFTHLLWEARRSDSHGILRVA
jgi:diguanylate cyclase (GGDEF)-like protein